MDNNDNKRILRIDVNSLAPMCGKTTVAAVIARALHEHLPAVKVEVLSQENDYLSRAEELCAGDRLDVNADLIQIVDINANPQPLREGAIYSTIPVDIQEMTHAQLTEMDKAPTDNAKPLWKNAPEWAMWLLKDHGQYTWAEVEPDADGGIAGRFEQAGTYTEGVSESPEARDQSVDDLINYPERPLALEHLVASIIGDVCGEAGIAQAEARTLIEIVLEDPRFHQCAEEFEADRGDQYNYLTVGAPDADDAKTFTTGRDAMSRG